MITLSDGSIVIETGLDSSGLEAGLGKMQGLVSSGAKVAAGAITAVATAMTAIGTASVAVGKEFETSMTKASTLFGDTSVNTEKLNQDVLNLSKTTGTAASELGDGLYSALSAGLPVSEDMNETMGFMEKNAKLAAAGFTDVDTAVGATAKVLNAYKMDVSETDKVHKILMQTQNDGITTVGELGSVLAQVTPTAAAMNVGFDQVGASLATMTAQGTPAAQATTQLNSLFAELGKSGTQANGALEKATEGTKHAGKSFQDLMAEGVPLNEVMDLMGDYAKENDKSLLDMFSSIEAGKAALAVSGQNAETYTKNLADMSTETDVVGDAYEKMSDTLEFKSNQMKESVKSLGIEFYEGMETPLKEAVETGIEYVEQLSQAFQDGGLEGAVEAAGDIFADIAVKAAESAPEMIDAAVSVIEAFITGLYKNKGRLSKAALDIAVSLANGLIKFLPKQMQKPAQDAVKALSTSLTSGGLKSAIDTVCQAFGNIVTILGNIAEVVLPALTGAIDFAAGKLQYIIPIIAAAAAAFTALKIVTLIAGGTQALSTALMAHTAIAKVATTAQLAFNMAVAAGPIGLLVTALAAAVAGFGAYKLMTEDVVSGVERLKESQEALAEAYSGIGKAASDFTAGISTAESHLSAFDSTLFASNEEQQQLSANMQEVQNGITTICRTASDERRDYTAEEIKQLDEYFSRLRELNNQQLAIEEAKMGAIRQQAITAAHDRDSDLSTYQQTAQEWINTAEQQAESEINIIKSQSDGEIALLNERKENQRDMSAQEYKEQYDAIKAREELKISSVEKEQARISKSFADGIAERITADEEYNSIIQEANAQKEQEDLRHHDELRKIRRQYNTDLEQTNGDQAVAQANQDAALERERNTHAANMGKINSQITDGLSAESQNQIGVLLALLAQTTSNGKALNGATKETVSAMLDSWEELPEGAKDTIGNTILPMLEGLSDSIPELKGLAEDNGQGIITALRDVLGIHSPSKETTEISQYTVQGLKEPLEKAVPQMRVRATALGNAIINALNVLNLPEKSRQLGIDFANGYIGGMSSKTSAVQTAAANLANAALAAVKKAQASASPSKKAAKLGKDFKNGYAAGIKKDVKVVEKSASELAEKALKKLRSANGNYEEVGKAALESYETGMEKQVNQSESRVEKLINKQVSKAVKNYKASIKTENDRLRKTITDENKKTVEDQIKANEKAAKTFEDNYKKLGSTTLKAYSDALEKEAKSIQKKLSDTIDEITKEYQDKYDKVINLRDSMQDKLAGNSLFKKDGNELLLTDLNQELQDIAEYDANLSKLKNKVSADLMADITQMSAEDAIAYTDKLLAMSDTELKQYSDLYDKKNSAAKETARKFYQEELDTIKKEFTGKINTAFASMKKDMDAVGKNVAKGFIDGLKSQSKNLESAVKNMSKAILKQVKKDFGIKSPSKEFKGIARNCTDGYELEYKDGMKDAQKTVEKSNQGLLATAREGLDYAALAAQMRAGIAAENARMAQRVSAVVNYQVSGTVRAEEATAGRRNAKLGEEIVDAFSRAGIGIKWDMREFGRLVKGVT